MISKGPIQGIEMDHHLGLLLQENLHVGSLQVRVTKEILAVIFNGVTILCGVKLLKKALKWEQT